MELKLRRSQRDAGVITTTAMFCLDARVSFTPGESASLTRYKLRNQVIYNSQASEKHIEQARQYGDGSMVGSLKGIAHFALAKMHLNISIASLERGQRVECKGLEELMAAEAAVMQACGNLRQYLTIAATFDGGDALYTFDEEGNPILIATSASPQAVLIESSSVSPGPMPAQPAALPPPMHADEADTTMFSTSSPAGLTAAASQFETLSHGEKFALMMTVVSIAALALILFSPQIRIDRLITVPLAVVGWIVAYKKFR